MVCVIAIFISFLIQSWNQDTSWRAAGKVENYYNANRPISLTNNAAFTGIDKKLKSSYKSAITKRINNIVKLYEDGQLSAIEANKLISELKTQSGTGTKKTKKAKKITFKVSSPKALPKINIKISSPVSKIKLKSAPKVKLSTSSNRKYTIKA